MDKNELTKTELWTKRIQDFHESGLSQKEWCQEHQISRTYERATRDWRLL